jgi:hypothetical protein
MSQLKPNEYECAVCHEVFEMGWSEEEAEAELKTKFPGFEKSECDIVCDDCFKLLGLESDDVTT